MEDILKEFLKRLLKEALRKQVWVDRDENIDDIIWTGEGFRRRGEIQAEEWGGWLEDDEEKDESRIEREDDLIETIDSIRDRIGRLEWQDREIDAYKALTALEAIYRHLGFGDLAATLEASLDAIEAGKSTALNEVRKGKIEGIILNFLTDPQVSRMIEDRIEDLDDEKLETCAIVFQRIHLMLLGA